MTPGLLKTYCFSALVEGQRGFNFNILIQFWLLIMEACQLASFKVQGGCTYIYREFAPWTPVAGLGSIKTMLEPSFQAPGHEQRWREPKRKTWFCQDSYSLIKDSQKIRNSLNSYLFLKEQSPS